MKKIKWIPLITNLALSLGAGLLASELTRGNQTLFDEIVKPPFTPPAVVFPIVWTILYVLMGISAYLICTSYSEKKQDAFFIYKAQLALNVIWSFIFFTCREFGVAFIWIVALWISIYTMIRMFLGINKWAGWLQIPYIIWVSIATYLTFGIYYLN